MRISLLKLFSLSHLFTSKKKVTPQQQKIVQVALKTKKTTPQKTSLTTTSLLSKKSVLTEKANFIFQTKFFLPGSPKEKTQLPFPVHLKKPIKQEHTIKKLRLQIPWKQELKTLTTSKGKQPNLFRDIFRYSTKTLQMNHKQLDLSRFPAQVQKKLLQNKTILRKAIKSLLFLRLTDSTKPSSPFLSLIRLRSVLQEVKTLKHMECFSPKSWKALQKEIKHEVEQKTLHLLRPPQTPKSAYQLIRGLYNFEKRSLHPEFHFLLRYTANPKLFPLKSLLRSSLSFIETSKQAKATTSSKEAHFSSPKEHGHPSKLPPKPPVKPALLAQQKKQLQGRKGKHQLKVSSIEQSLQFLLTTSFPKELVVRFVVEG